jgi:mitochondrial fission protein ELM1
MTAPARITRADMDRATKSVAAAKLERARIIMDLANQRIEIIIGGPANDSPEPSKWDDDDV